MQTRYYRTDQGGRRIKVVTRYEKCEAARCSMCEHLSRLQQCPDIPPSIMNLAEANHKRHLRSEKHWHELGGLVYVQKGEYKWELTNSWTSRK